MFDQSIDPIHQKALLKHLESVERTENWFVFGPKSRKQFRDLYNALDYLGIGYCAGFYGEDTKKKKKISSTELYLAYVSYRQADKLSKVLSKLGVESERDYAEEVLKKESKIEQKQQAFLEEQKKQKERKRAEKAEKIRKAKQSQDSDELITKMEFFAEKPDRWAELLK